MHDYFEKYQFEAKNANDLLFENLKLKKIIDKMKSKRLELTPECIKYWAKKAIDEGMSFKPFVEAHLEREATSNSFEKTAVRGAKKNKNK